jgi:hypothetical protein
MPTNPLKREWDDQSRDKFLATLGRWDYLGTDHLGADLYQLGDACLAWPVRVHPRPGERLLGAAGRPLRQPD